MNEEALSINEEFQSTNEELETSREELQSLNEELTTTNTQLHETLERQRGTADDLQNILNSSKAYARGSGGSTCCGECASFAKRPGGSAPGREPGRCGRRCRGEYRRLRAVCGAD